MKIRIIKENAAKTIREYIAEFAIEWHISGLERVIRNLNPDDVWVSIFESKAINARDETYSVQINRGAD